MGKIKDSWQVVVFTMVITLLGNIVYSNYIANRNNIDNAASVEYVNERDYKIIQNYEKADDEIKEELNNKVDKGEIEDMKHTLEIMDERIYEMWKREFKND